MKSLDIIIPVYNSEQSLGNLITEILNEDSLKSYELGIILINDGSKDESLEVCNSYSERFSQITVIDLMKNYGQHAALFAGISYSRAELIVTMDDDGQHPPSAIATLLNSLTEELDVIYGLAAEEKHSWHRNLSSKIFKKVLFLGVGIRHGESTSAFRAIRRITFEGIDFTSLSSSILEVAINWNTNRIGNVRVSMSKRVSGKSNYTFVKLLRFGTEMLTSYSIRPLRVATLVGLLGFIGSLGLSFFYFIEALTSGFKVEGFATLVVLITFLSSIQLITLGIFGEYLGKIHERNIGKPHFVVRSVRNKG